MIKILIDGVEVTLATLIATTSKLTHIDMDTDYRLLLKKYMMHIGYHEGIDYTRDMDKSDVLTDDEWILLQKLSHESRYEKNRSK